MLRVSDRLRHRRRQPFSVAAWTFGTHKVPEETIAKLIPEVFPLTPQGMIDHLNLRRPIYKKTAAYGHFGRNDPDFTWEATDMIDAVRAAAQV